LLLLHIETLLFYWIEHIIVYNIAYRYDKYEQI